MPATDRLGEHVAKTGNRIVRPRDLDYRDPTLVLRLLEDRKAIFRLAHGYYLVPPDTHRGVRRWRVAIESLALGVAVADYGRDKVALMGVSAARLRGIPPRPVSSAVVAIPKTYRPRLRTELGEIHFVHRDLRKLDLERADTDVVASWATTPEQTILDVARRPGLGGISPSTASEIITSLAVEADWEILARVAREQRRLGALARASWIAAAVREVDHVRVARTPSLGLRPVRHVDPARFGIVD